MAISFKAPRFAILRACYRARKPQNPESTREKYKIPHPGLPPPKIHKNYRKNTKTAQKRQFFGVSKPGHFPLFSGMIQIVSRTLSGLFLVGALDRPRKRKRTNRENPRTIPEQIGRIPEKSGKSQKGQKKGQKTKDES